MKQWLTWRCHPSLASSQVPQLLQAHIGQTLSAASAQCSGRPQAPAFSESKSQHRAQQ